MSRRGPGRSLMIAATALVLATLAMAVWVMESPAKQRDRRLDERRVLELQAIGNAVEEWTTANGRLPRSLADLAGQPGAALSISDPANGTPYDYHVVSPSRYRLCATFATSTSDRDPEARDFAGLDEKWKHPAGRHCIGQALGPAAMAALSAEAPASPR